MSMNLNIPDAAEINSNKEKIIQYLMLTKRPGIEDLIRWLETGTDYFIAPASTKYHEAYQGGLAEHSLCVLKKLLAVLNSQYGTVSDEMRDKAIICALLHDLCKTNFYKVSTRNVKNEQTGRWEAVPYYTIEDSYCFGHGEGSVRLISKYIDLTEEEELAIRWHMGGFDDATKGGSYACGNAWEKYPFGAMLHTADLLATYCKNI